MLGKYKYRDLSREDFDNAFNAYISDANDIYRSGDFDNEYRNYKEYNGNVYGCPTVKGKDAAGISCDNIACYSCWNAIINYYDDNNGFWKVI